MKHIFKNTEQNRLRTGWRVLLFIIVFWVFSALIFAFKLLFPEVSKREFLSGYSVLIVALLAFAATVASLIACRFLDKRSFRSLGLKTDGTPMKDLFFGFLISFGMAGIFLLILYTFGMIDVKGFEFKDMVTGQGFLAFMSVFSLGSMMVLLLEYILVGYWEELVFRGYLFKNLSEGIGLKLTILISCILYGVIHSSNPNAGLLSSVIIIAFGFLRIYGVLLTKTLWLSMGMHIGWNFFQGPIFGFNASGHSQANFLIHEFTSDKEYLTGGAFGPEGSILILPVLLLAIAVMYLYAKRNPEFRNKTLISLEDSIQ